jgi:hypothetical protein
VLFRLKDRSPQSIEKTASVLRSMEGRIPSLIAVEVAADERHASNAYDIALRTSFESWPDYDAYRVHPYHLDPVLAHMHAAAESAAVVDFESAAPFIEPFGA